MAKQQNTEPIALKGVTPSADLLRNYAGQDILVAFSRGKDSIAAWIAAEQAGLNVIGGYHLYGIPGLEFERRSLDYYQEFFGKPILHVPHPSFYRMVANLVFQPPERLAVIDAAELSPPEYEDVEEAVRLHFNSPDAWTVDGIRAADSSMRRVNLIRSGPVLEKRRRLRGVWDWRKGTVDAALARAGVRLPDDYLWFGRSFEGLQHLPNLIRYAPDDYHRVIEWFPLAEMLLLYRADPDELRRLVPLMCRGTNAEYVAAEIGGDGASL
jgi:hypothetical protein